MWLCDQLHTYGTILSNNTLCLPAAISRMAHHYAQPPIRLAWMGERCSLALCGLWIRTNDNDELRYVAQTEYHNSCATRDSTILSYSTVYWSALSWSSLVRYGSLSFVISVNTAPLWPPNRSSLYSRKSLVRGDIARTSGRNLLMLTSTPTKVVAGSTDPLCLAFHHAFGNGSTTQATPS